jgi:hypothetical protein
MTDSWGQNTLKWLDDARYELIDGAAHGLATVAYATGGVLHAVCRLIEAPLPSAGIEAFARDFAWEIFGKRLSAVFRRSHDHDPDARPADLNV